MRLVLWDIDHTLISTRGMGRELSAIAFQETTGVPMREQAVIDGITEPVIFRETAALHGLRTNRHDFVRFAQALAKLHCVREAELRLRGCSLPGAAAALGALASRTDIEQSVVSGNVKPVARTKLHAFGLDGPIVWNIGAYGEDADERADLVGLSLDRAARSPTETVLIGDTPADVQGAHAHGVRVIAVATGKSSEDQLAKAGAECVLPDLSDTDAFVRLVVKKGDI